MIELNEKIENAKGTVGFEEVLESNEEMFAYSYSGKYGTVITGTYKDVSFGMSERNFSERSYFNDFRKAKSTSERVQILNNYFGRKL